MKQLHVLSLLAAAFTAVAATAALTTSCEPELKGITFDPEAEIINDGAKVYSDDDLSIVIKSNHETYVLEDYSVDERLILPEGILVKGKTYRSEEPISLKGVSVVENHSGEISLTLKDPESRITKSLALPYSAFKSLNLSAELSTDKISDKTDVELRVYCNYRTLTIEEFSSEFEFTDVLGKVVKGGTTYEIPSYGFLSFVAHSVSVDEDHIGSVRLNVYCEENAERASLQANYSAFAFKPEIILLNNDAKIHQGDDIRFQVKSPHGTYKLSNIFSTSKDLVFSEGSLPDLNKVYSSEDIHTISGVSIAKTHSALLGVDVCDITTDITRQISIAYTAYNSVILSAEIANNQIIDTKDVIITLFSNHSSITVSRLDSPFEFEGLQVGKSYSIPVSGSLSFTARGVSISHDHSGQVVIGLLDEETGQSVEQTLSYSAYCFNPSIVAEDFSAMTPSGVFAFEINSNHEIFRLTDVKTDEKLLLVKSSLPDKDTEYKSGTVFSLPIERVRGEHSGTLQISLFDPTTQLTSVLSKAYTITSGSTISVSLSSSEILNDQPIRLSVSSTGKKIRVDALESEFSFTDITTGSIYTLDANGKIEFSTIAKVSDSHSGSIRIALSDPDNGSSVSRDLSYKTLFGNNTLSSFTLDGISSDTIDLGLGQRESFDLVATPASAIDARIVNAYSDNPDVSVSITPDGKSVELKGAYLVSGSTLTVVAGEAKISKTFRVNVSGKVCTGVDFPSTLNGTLLQQGESIEFIARPTPLDAYDAAEFGVCSSDDSIIEITSLGDYHYRATSRGFGKATITMGGKHYSDCFELNCAESLSLPESVSVPWSGEERIDVNGSFSDYTVTCGGKRVAERDEDAFKIDYAPGIVVRRSGKHLMVRNIQRSTSDTELVLTFTSAVSKQRADIRVILLGADNTLSASIDCSKSDGEGHPIISVGFHNGTGLAWDLNRVILYVFHDNAPEQIGLAAYERTHNAEAHGDIIIDGKLVARCYSLQVRLPQRIDAYTPNHITELVLDHAGDDLGKYNYTNINFEGVVITKNGERIFF